MKLTPAPLRYGPVSLIPLAPELHAGLAEVALQNPEVFRHIPYRMDSAEHVAGVLRLGQQLQDSGQACVFCVWRDGDSTPLGSTSLRVVDEQVPSFEIGGTWLISRVQRTDVNTCAKRALMAFAFDVLEASRVEFKTDILNLASQKAIERLGAVREGVLRAQMRRADGSLRDSVYYSVLREEWPAVRGRLEAMRQR